MNNNYAQHDPLKFAEGAFKGLTTMVPHARVARAGNTFAVAAAFPWLTFAQSITGVGEYGQTRWSKSSWLRAIYDDASERFRRAPSSPTLYLPAPSAAGVTDIDASAGVGGGVHEAGHIVCDCAGLPFPSFADFEKKIGVHLDQGIPYHQADLKKWANVAADMRLEPGMARLYPDTEVRFHSIQSWVHKIEAEVRGTSVPSDFLMALRDSGKGWVSDKSKAVYAEYSEEARQLVENLRPIWGVLRPTHTEWHNTAHLPVVVAIQIINKLHDLLKEKMQQEQNGEGKGDPQDGKGEPQQGKGSSGEGDPQQGDGEPQQGEGKGKGEPQQGEGKGEPQDGKGKPNPKGGKNGISVSDLDKLLKGEGEALDPSSAMKQAVQKASNKLDHKLYVPNGYQPVVRSMFDKKKR